MKINEKEKNMNEIETLIGEQCLITGSIKGNGTIKIDGNIEGDIIWQDDVILGVTSIDNGNISCKNAFISGKVTGNVICENNLVIEGCGHLKGDITVKRLTIKEGGIFDGKCTMVISETLENMME